MDDDYDEDREWDGPVGEDVKILQFNSLHLFQFVMLIIEIIEFK